MSDQGYGEFPTAEEQRRQLDEALETLREERDEARARVAQLEAYAKEVGSALDAACRAAGWGDAGGHVGNDIRSLGNAYAHAQERSATAEAERDEALRRAERAEEGVDRSTRASVRLATALLDNPERDRAIEWGAALLEAQAMDLGHERWRVHVLEEALLEEQERAAKAEAERGALQVAVERWRAEGRLGTSEQAKSRAHRPRRACVICGAILHEGVGCVHHPAPAITDDDGEPG